MQKHAVITGGGTGIGRAIATALHDQGCTITIMGRREDVLENAAQSHGWGTQVLDVTDEKSVVDGMARAADFGGGVDIVVANAGIAEGQNIRGSDLGFWRNIMATNLDGAYLTIREGLRHMPVKSWGRVVAVSSIAGLRGLKGAHAYTASKHGMVGLIRGLSADHTALPVTFNAVCPGYVDTDIIARNTQSIAQKAKISEHEARDMMVNLNPHNRLITPEEVAASVAWICGPGSDSVDGQAIEISGGPA